MGREAVGAVVVQAVCRGGLGWRFGARVARTANIAYMVVTLEVSKLSVSLNAVAYCRKEGILCAARCRVPVGRRRRARLMAGGGRARAERTANIFCMVVTLDVSKLSGWLNADAPCRVERRACDVGRGAAREA